MKRAVIKVAHELLRQWMNISDDISICRIFESRRDSDFEYGRVSIMLEGDSLPDKCKSIEGGIALKIDVDEIGGTPPSVQ
jgi:hypothetical protein